MLMNVFLKFNLEEKWDNYWSIKNNKALTVKYNMSNLTLWDISSKINPGSEFLPLTNYLKYDHLLFITSNIVWSRNRAYILYLISLLFKYMFIPLHSAGQKY
jgi:hypothetical protein